MSNNSFMERLLNGAVVEWKPLGEVCDNISSGKNKEKYESGLYPIYGSTGIIGRTNYKRYEKSHILVARVGANAGYVNIAQGEYDVSDNTLILQNKKNIILKFLYYILINIKLNKFAHGAGQPLVTAGIIKSIKIPIPPLDIQKEIVRILDNFTELTNNITLLLKSELEARKKQYEYYRDMLLTTSNSPYIGGEVEWKSLGEIAKIYDGTHSTPKYKSFGVPFVSVKNIKNLYSTDTYISVEDFEKYKYKPQKNDLFMTRIGDIGTCAIVENDEPLAYYVTLTLIRVNQEVILPKYLKFVIESGIGKYELYKRTLINATPIKINLGEIGKIIIPIPPLDIQKEIVRILDNFMELTNNITLLLKSELEARKKQYEYYRDMLLTFPPPLTPPQ